MTKLKIPHLNRWDVDKFWNNDNFIYRPETGCLEWQRYLDFGGYGKVQINGVPINCHRLAYFIYYQQDPGELLVRHICHNRICAHPLHLTLGTHWDNSQDMVNAGRSQLGEKHWTKRRPDLLPAARKAWAANGSRNIKKLNANHPCTVLTDELVREIKGHIANGVDNRTLAKAYGVTHSNISAIARGKSWKHIDIPMPPRKTDMSYAQKLTADQVREIRRRGDAGESGESLAREFNIGATAVFKIRHRITWKDID